MVSTIPSLFTLINTTPHKLITILPFFYLKMFRKVQRRNFTFIGKRTEYNLHCTYTQYRDLHYGRKITISIEYYRTYAKPKIR